MIWTVTTTQRKIKVIDVFVRIYGAVCLSMYNQGKHHWIRQYMKALRGSYCTLEFSEKLKEAIWILLQPVLVKATASLLYFLVLFNMILFKSTCNLDKEQCSIG